MLSSSHPQRGRPPGHSAHVRLPIMVQCSVGGFRCASNARFIHSSTAGLQALPLCRPTRPTDASTDADHAAALPLHPPGQGTCVHPGHHLPGD